MAAVMPPRDRMTRLYASWVSVASLRPVRARSRISGSSSSSRRTPAGASARSSLIRLSTRARSALESPWSAGFSSAGSSPAAPGSASPSPPSPFSPNPSSPTAPTSGVSAALAAAALRRTASRSSARAWERETARRPRSARSTRRWASVRSREAPATPGAPAARTATAHRVTDTSSRLRTLALRADVETVEVAVETVVSCWFCRLPRSRFFPTRAHNLVPPSRTRPEGDSPTCAARDRTVSVRAHLRRPTFSAPPWGWSGSLCRATRRSEHHQGVAEQLRF